MIDKILVKFITAPFFFFGEAILITMFLLIRIELDVKLYLKLFHQLIDNSGNYFCRARMEKPLRNHLLPLDIYIIIVPYLIYLLSFALLLK